MSMLDFGREICGNLATAESREWLCTNGVGDFASGTVAGLLTRRYHGLLVAALKPPVGRTLLVAKLDETAEYDGRAYPLFTNRWADGNVEPRGWQHIERFYLEGTSPVWHFACADALIEKRLWMEPGATTTYVRYELLRGGGPVRLSLRALVNYRDFHATTRGDNWQMRVEPVAGGVRVSAFDGARPFVVLADGARAEPAHEWYRRFGLAVEARRGLDAADDLLHAGTFETTLEPGGRVKLVLSTEAEPPLDGERAWERRQRHEADLLGRWRKAGPTGGKAPDWIQRLVLAADQFVVGRPLPDDPSSMSVIAGYPWFGDWGRDTMISLPGLTLVTGRADVARRILLTFARFVDRGMIPNVFPDSGQEPEYNTVDAALWYVEAVRAYHAATGDGAFVKQIFPVLEEIIRCYRDGTRHGIGMDAADGLLRSGEPGVQLTWMDAKVGDWVVTPRMGKAVEINALWHNALGAVAALAPLAGRPPAEWELMAERAARGFERFWNAGAGCCYDVIDGPDGDDGTLRPNQVLDACARHLLTSFGLRSLAPGDPRYQGRYGGGPVERDGAYHQGTVWGWLLGPFALAHLRVHGDVDAARRFLEPMAHHLADFCVGSIAEIFDGDPPFTPRGCPAQAWSVAETLRAWCEITAAAAARPRAPSRRRSPAGARRGGRPS